MEKVDTREILISSAKSIFGAVPFAGTALNELFFEYNGNIKQKRLNNFVEILSEYFSTNTDDNIKNIKTEDFNDIFESVLRRVVRTKSNLKLIRFRDILIKELNSPTKETELIDLYLDLITSLSEEELIILYNHRHFDKTYTEELDKLQGLKTEYQKVLENKKRETIIISRSKYEDEYLQLKEEIEKIENKHDSLKVFRTAEHYNIEKNKFFFYVQRLYSKGLIYDDGIGKLGGLPFKLMNITEFGVEFMHFIKGHEK